MRPTSDTEIRAALHRKKFRALSTRSDTLIIDELGLAHAKVRIDIAVINGSIHGFEIKSAADTLARLPKQLATYEECLEMLTIVCADKHVPEVRKLAPSWPARRYRIHHTQGVQEKSKCASIQACAFALATRSSSCADPSECIATVTTEAAKTALQVLGYATHDSANDRLYQRFYGDPPSLARSSNTCMM